MRRIVLAFAVVLSVLATTTSTHAAVARPLRHSSLAGVLTHLSHLRAVSGIRSTHQLRTLSTDKAGTNAPPRQSVQTLFLPSSAFSPAVENTQYHGQVSAQDADQNWFRQEHSNGANGNYENFGFVFGAYQRADWSVSNPLTYFRWQGSYMNSVSGAQSAMTDGITFMQQQSGNSSNACTNMPAGFQCRYIDSNWQDSGGTQYFERYFALQYNQCLGEISGDLPTAADVGSTSSTFDTVANKMIDAAVTAMQNTCGGGTTGGGNPTPPPTPRPTTPAPTPVPTTPTPRGTTSFHLVTARFEKSGAQPDYNLTNPPMTQAKVGAKVQIAMYVYIGSLDTSSVTLTRTYSLKQGGKTLLSYSGSDPIASGDVPDTWWYALYYKAGVTPQLKLTKPGTYTFTATVSMEGQTDTAQSQIQIVKSPSKAKKVSFSFDSLQTQTDGGQVTNTFRTGQSINLHLGWTIKNLKGATKASISRSLLANIGGNWKAVNTSVVTSTALNGRNDASVSLQISSPGTFQIAVRLSVGSGSQNKTVTVNVTR